ncbi:MAG TPA: hypothetical protein VJN89_13465 [Candidatus Acidoferrum sp.]|nr:hypothetical protein [Candidatus Acidoferrum sp.]
MTEEMENILRKSLDEVDRTRKRQWMYLALCSACLSVFLFNIWGTAQRAGETRLGAEVLVGAIISILTNVLVVLGLSLFINRMTNKILKAIELLSKE